MLELLKAIWFTIRTYKQQPLDLPMLDYYSRIGIYKANLSYTNLKRLLENLSIFDARERELIRSLSNKEINRLQSKVRSLKQLNDSLQETISNNLDKLKSPQVYQINRDGKTWEDVTEEVFNNTSNDTLRRVLSYGHRMPINKWRSLSVTELATIERHVITNNGGEYGFVNQVMIELMKKNTI